MAEKAPPQSGFDQAQLYLWVKGLESKVNNLLREVDLIKNDFIKKNSDLKKDVKSLTDELLEIKREQDKTLERMDMVIKELKQTAGIEELMVLKKYVELWNPMNFVTQKDLDRVIDRTINQAIESKLKQNIIDGRIGEEEHYGQEEPEIDVHSENIRQTNKKERHLPFV